MEASTTVRLRLGGIWRMGGGRGSPSWGGGLYLSPSGGPWSLGMTVLRVEGWESLARLGIMVW